jgi:hypothetical protein
MYICIGIGIWCENFEERWGFSGPYQWSSSSLPESEALVHKILQAELEVLDFVATKCGGGESALALLSWTVFSIVGL